MLNRPAFGTIKRHLCVFRRGDGANNKQNNQNRCDPEDRVMYVDTLLLNIVLTDLMIG